MGDGWSQRAKGFISPQESSFPLLFPPCQSPPALLQGDDRLSLNTQECICQQLPSTRRGEFLPFSHLQGDLGQAV